MNEQYERMTESQLRNEMDVLWLSIMEYGKVAHLLEVHKVEAADFLHPDNIYAWNVVHGLIKNNAPVTAESFKIAYCADGKHEILKALDILDCYVIAETAEHHIIELKKARQRRELRLLAHKIEREEGEIEEIIVNAIGSLSELESKFSPDGSKVAKFSDFKDRIRAHITNKNQASGFSTGWNGLDHYWKHKPGNLVILTGIPMSGKALALNTPLLTVNGWKTMGTIKVGDIVFDEKGNQCNVVGVTDIMENRPCYEVKFSNNETIIADAEHEWLTRDDKARRSKIQTIKKRGITREETKPRGTDQRWKKTYPSIKTTREISNTLFVASDNRKNHAISIAMPLWYEHRDDLLIHPYALGAWIGDGRTDYAAITDAEGHVVSRLSSLGYVITKQAQQYQYGIVDGFVSKLRQEGVLGNKHIPRKYLCASIEQRLELLRGLMDTDGYISKKGRCEYCTIKKEIADGVLELVTSLGIKANINTGIASCNGKNCGIKYRVIFTANSIDIFSLPRKKERIPKYSEECGTIYINDCKPCESVPVRCIQVDSPSHLYLAGKKLIPTHNSEWLDQIVINAIQKHKWKFCIFSPENYPPEFHFQKLAEKLIGKPMFEKAGRAAMSMQEMGKAMDMLSEHIAVITPEESGMSIDSILNKVRLAKKQYGCDVVIIDPYNEVEHKRNTKISETEYISEFLSKVRNFGRIHDIEMIVVAHPTKMIQQEDGEYRVPTLYDVSGSANFRNKADIGISVWRSFQKKDNITQVHITKVRDKNIGRMGQVNFEWDWATGCYVMAREQPIERK